MKWKKKFSWMTSTASAAEHTLLTTPGFNDGGKPKQIKTEKKGKRKTKKRKLLRKRPQKGWQPTP